MESESRKLLSPRSDQPVWLRLTRLASFYKTFYLEKKFQLTKSCSELHCTPHLNSPSFNILSRLHAHLLSLKYVCILLL